ncbi:MAG: hypothetical protein QXL76_00140 [Candidatus Rehaiarchaeum fermentans]|nr:hypothetical protein [Candidatus Rehaiarchaeum fermentans]
MTAQGVYLTFVGLLIVIIASVILIISYLGVYSFVGSIGFGSRCAAAIAQLKIDSFIFPIANIFNFLGGNINLNTQAQNLESACLQENSIPALNAQILGAELYTYISACYSLGYQLQSFSNLLSQSYLRNVFLCEEGKISTNNTVLAYKVINYINSNYKSTDLKSEFLTNSSNGGAMLVNNSFLIKPNSSILIAFVYNKSTICSSLNCQDSACISNFNYQVSFLQNDFIDQPNLSAYCSSNYYSPACQSNFSKLVVSSLPSNLEGVNSPLYYCGYKYNDQIYNLSMPICGSLPIFALNGESRVIVCIS